MQSAIGNLLYAPNSTILQSKFEQKLGFCEGIAGRNIKNPQEFRPEMKDLQTGMGSLEGRKNSEIEGERFLREVVA